MFDGVLSTTPLKLTIKTQEQCYACGYCTFIVDFEHLLLRYWFSCIFHVEAERLLMVKKSLDFTYCVV